MVTIRQLTIFTQVVRHGSFRACSEHIGLSQVVVSNHVRELEKGLGTVLFTRRPGQRAELTAQGRHAFERLSSILADLGDLQRELIGEQAQSRINVTTYSFIMLRLQDRIEAFQQARPQVDLRFDLDPPENAELVAQVQRGEVDLACYFSIGADDALGSVAVGAERLAVYVGRNHPLAGQTDIAGSTLNDYPAIVLNVDNPQRRLCDEALASIGARAGNVLMETNALPLLLNNVRRGRAWICLFEGTEHDMGEGLVRLDLAEPLPPATIQLLVRPSARHDANLRALREAFARP